MTISILGENHRLSEPWGETQFGPLAGNHSRATANMGAGPIKCCCKAKPLPFSAQHFSCDYFADKD
ncbi:hypothetical protein CICLE_v10004029mg [Citrus x clementina]|uniref:Uncharacterized protein n=1 Tax=Citrus clementina TaxID=85681 RepID=V4T4N8_CITCL|nr:hypothetical protein CICLE_v10004029mg [Citrus x clementina]